MKCGVRFVQQMLWTVGYWQEGGVGLDLSSSHYHLLLFANCYTHATTAAAAIYILHTLLFVIVIVAALVSQLQLQL